MAAIRKKRNFKGLGLDVSQPSPTLEPEPVPILSTTRPAPTPQTALKSGAVSAASAGGLGAATTGPAKTPGTAKKRPGALTIAAPKIPSKPATNTNDDGMLTISASPATGGAAGGASPFRSNYQNTLTQQLEALNLGQVTLKAEDLKEVGDLGSGNGGSVKKVEHIPTGTLMAKKIVLIDAKPAVRKQILRELHILHGCHDPHIISFYGAFVTDPNVCICIEFMDKGSLDGIYKKSGPIPIDVVGKIAWSVLMGLTYLYDVHRIIHRDIKPSNILCNSQGEIKVCDFGVSGELINSVADTFVGTSTYMSPERIQGAQYTVKSDVWSLGISLIELALGRFPFSESDSDDENDSDLEGTLSPSRHAPPIRPLSISATTTAKKDKRKSKGVSLQGGGMTMSILELLQHIVNEPAPKLTPEGKFPKDSEEFIDACLLKDPERRPPPKELLTYPWMLYTKENKVDLVAWAATV